MASTAPRADAAAASVGARDLFVLRRVTGNRFVHLGGSGRGSGWAGLIEVTSDEESSLGDALRSRRAVRLDHGGAALVFGPYYAHSAVFVPVTNDVVVVFGSSDADLQAADDAQLQAAATLAADAVDAVSPAKRLADELEEVGAVYLASGERLETFQAGWQLRCSDDQLREALRSVLDQGRFPFCVQDANVVPLPPPLLDEPGIRSYYLLELAGVARGVLFLAHTDAAPRGFTLLCRRLGVRLADVVSAQLGVALTREWCRAEAARLHGEFGKLDAFS